MRYRAYLNETTPKSPPRRIGPLTAVSSIGRMAASTVALAGDRSVSQLHAEIRQTPEGDYVLEDRMSLNGTYVEGRKVTRHPLHHGQTFRIGDSTMEFELVPEDDVIHSVPVATVSQGTVESVTVLGTPGSRAVVLGRDDSVDVRVPPATQSSGIFKPVVQIDDAAELRRDYEKLRIAHSILAAVARPMPLDQTLRVIAMRAFEALPAQRFVVLLVADGTGALNERLALDRDGKPPENGVPVSRTLLNRVLTAGRPLVARDVGAISDVGDAASIVQAAVRSVVCAPILDGSELYGVLYADNRAPSEPFDEKDLHLLSAIANQLALALRNARLVVEVREEARRRSVLGRFLSPNIVNEVLGGRISLSRTGESRNVAVLFSDIRGFTALSEKMAARDVTALLNEHFDVLVDVLFRFNGTLDKFIGDCLMAVFGAPTAGTADAESAVRCGLEMQSAIARLNTARRLRGDIAVEIGVGVNFGEVSWGPIGSHDMMGYTVVGDVVNLASRLCGVAKPGDVLVSRSVKERLTDGFTATSLGMTHVKGHELQIEPWRVDWA